VLGTFAAIIKVYLLTNNKHCYYIMFIIPGASYYIIVVSFFVYLFVNLFENLIHYNIGKFSNKETKFDLPSQKDWIKIVAVMFVFALMQGLLTYYFTSLHR